MAAMTGSCIHRHSQLPDDPSRVDHLSNLPDDLIVSILSYLKTCEAARTSLLSHRFRYLWESHPSLHFIPQTRCNEYVAMVDRALLQRNPAMTLVSLYFNLVGVLEEDQSLRTSLISSWLVKARQLGVRHLTIYDCCTTLYPEPLLPIIFSMNSLESLSVPAHRLPTEYRFPSAITLTSLKSLHFDVIDINSAELNRLLSELCCLEDLKLEYLTGNLVSLSSQTIRKLNLRKSDIVTLELSMPSLEFLHYEPCWMTGKLYGDIPSLRKAVFVIAGLRNRKTQVDAFNRVLEYVLHAEEFILNIKESQVNKLKSPFLFFYAIQLFIDIFP